MIPQTPLCVANRNTYWVRKLFYTHELLAAMCLNGRVPPMARRVKSGICGNFGAESAHSGKIALTVWASSSHSRRFSPIAALARSYFCKIKSVTTSPVGPPKNWPEGGCVWGLKRQLWWQPNAIHDLPLLLIRDAPLLGIESLRVWLIQEEFRRSGPECGPFINQRFNIVAFPRGAEWFWRQGENLVLFVVLVNYWYLF